jgi:biofilm PGA synthesis N-glycosyltransferase PgaC
MYIWLSFLVVTMLLLSACLACFFDNRRLRLPSFSQPISFLIPCYNDGSTVASTIQSILAIRDPSTIEIMVADDASTDHSAAILDGLRNQYPIQVVHNPVNLGKAETLNRLAKRARHDLIVFVDADTCLNRNALNDMTTRLAHDPNLGAVSCPYRPANRGWLPRLQSIDYSMISVLQGAYNYISGLALWGGCIAVRKNAFEQVGGFSLSAITEDVNLAYMLNRTGWRVEQSMIPVESHVPDTCRGWIKQKIRWTAGGFQCLIRYPSVWMRHPLQVMLILLYSILSLNAAFTFVRHTLLLDRAFDLVTPLVNIMPTSQLVRMIEQIYGATMLGSLQLMFCFTLLSAVYVVPLISKWRDSTLLLLIIPFSLAYFPFYTLLSLAGLIYLISNTRRIERTLRAW